MLFPKLGQPGTALLNRQMRNTQNRTAYITIGGFEIFGSEIVWV